MDCLYDTSAIYAVSRPDDPNHARARAFIRSPRLKLHTTSVIVGEAYTLLRRRYDYEHAMRWAATARRSNLVTIHAASSEDDVLAWTILERYSGVPLSYADASLIALGERLGIQSAFAFDEDFQQAGLALVP